MTKSMRKSVWPMRQLMVCLMVAAIFAAAGASARAALKSEYKLEETDATSAVTDRVPPVSNGAYENFNNSDLQQPPSPGDPAGASVEFRGEGSPGSFQTINLGDRLSGAGTATFTAWARFDDTSGDHTIASIGQFAGNEPLIFWRDENDSRTGTSNANTLAVLVGPDRISGPVDLLNDNDWHHLAFTFEGNSSDGLRIYADGRPVGETATTASLIGGGGTDLTLGIPSESPGASKQLDGNMDEVRLFDEVLPDYYLAQQGGARPTVFSDTFKLDPAATGATGRAGAAGFDAAWAESIDQGPDTSELGDIIATGEELVFQADRVNAGDFETYRITRTVDARGFDGLVLSLLARDDPTNSNEFDDVLRVLIDPEQDGSFETVFEQFDDFPTADQMNFFGGIDLSAADDTVFDLRIEARNNFEDYFIDEISITTIPTPAALPGGLMLLGAMALRRQRRVSRQ